MNIYNAVPGEPLPLGHRWENNALRIVFDISAWVDAFGAGTVRLLHQRQSDAAPYPVTVTRTDADGTPNSETGTLVLWDVSNADTAQVCHFGRAELRYYAGREGAETFLAKSDIWKTEVRDALGGAQADAPEAEEDWLATLLGATNDMYDNAAATQEAAETASAAAIAASAAQEAAETAASVLLFSPDSSVDNYLNDETFHDVIRGQFSADADSVVRAIAQIPISVTAKTAGNAANGWTALSSATVTARFAMDGELWHYAYQVTGSEQSVVSLFSRRAVQTSGTHTLCAQLRVTGGTLSVSSDAVMELSGVRASD